MRRERRPGTGRRTGLILGCIGPFILCLAAAPSLAAAQTNPASQHAHPAWSSAEMVTLAQGDILVKALATASGEPARVMAGIRIAADPASIWSVMTDCEAAPEYVPNLRACQLIERGDNYDLIEHSVKLSWLLPSVRYIFKATYRPLESIEFERVSGGLRHLKGAWTLVAVGDSETLVSYRVALRPGFPVPRWLVRRSLKKDLPAVLAALRDRVQSEALTRGNSPL